MKAGNIEVIFIALLFAAGCSSQTEYHASNIIAQLEEKPVSREGVDQATASNRFGREGSLFIETYPREATVEILDIDRSFQQGMKLEPGEYNVEITSNGFRKKNMRVEIKPGVEKNIEVTLVRDIKTTPVAVAQKKKTGGLPGQRWAVVIGVSKYKDHRIPSLNYAVKDAKAFYDWLTSADGGQYSSSRVKFLADEEATTKNIKSALFNWLKKPIAEDMVTIFFAGHGSPESPDFPDNLYLLPYDTQYDDISTTGFPMWDIETAIKRFIRAKKVVFIADACHSGGVGNSFDIVRRSTRGLEVNKINTRLQDLSGIGDGICVISASDDRQYSQESEDWGGGHGVFTYFLLKGLKGDADTNSDDRVTLGELTPYISQQVRRATESAQSPIVAGKFDPALSIGK